MSGQRTHILSEWGEHRPVCGTRGEVVVALQPNEATCQRCNPRGPHTLTFKYRSGRTQTIEVKS